MIKLDLPKVSSIAIIFLLLAGSVSAAIIPKLSQPAYAHTFTADESASFLSVIKILQAESKLVQENLASNPTLAQAHAKAIVNVVNGNHTFGVLPDEVSENNKRVAADIVKGANALRTAVNSKPSATQADIGTKLNYLDGVLQEAITVRVPKAHVNNFAINAQAVKNLVNETLRQYGYAFGMSKGNTAPASSISNMSAFQSAQALSSQSQSVLSQAKSFIPKNETSAATLSSISKVASDIAQLKGGIDTKLPYQRIASLVQKTVYPDINTAFHLKNK
ncbi:MAG TPA: hypothetical protein VE223_04185 [Nitrososphaeraceae archaeon]|nr:hypothetical protein [Nitrososphaeraceae archaeon]